MFFFYISAKIEPRLICQNVVSSFFRLCVSRLYILWVSFKWRFSDAVEINEIHSLLKLNKQRKSSCLRRFHAPFIKKIHYSFENILLTGKENPLGAIVAQVERTFFWVIGTSGFLCCMKQTYVLVCAIHWETCHGKINLTFTRDSNTKSKRGIPLHADNIT